MQKQRNKSQKMMVCKEIERGSKKFTPRLFVVEEQFTLADITLFVIIDQVI